MSARLTSGALTVTTAAQVYLVPARSVSHIGNLLQFHLRSFLSGTSRTVGSIELAPSDPFKRSRGTDMPHYELIDTMHALKVFLKRQKARNLLLILALN